MARIDYWQFLLDRQGNPLKEINVNVYLAGTTEEADIYMDATFGSPVKSSQASLKTNKYGFVQFWIGDEWEVKGGYDVDQQFKIKWYNNIDSIQEEIDNIYIFSPLRPIDISDDIKGVPDNKDKNKVISNTQGYNWNAHVDSIVPSASPHGIAPITLFDTGSVQSKVISNKLGYQMYQLAETSSSTPIDVSAAGIYSETFSGWSASGDDYYYDLVHNLSNFYPVVRLFKDSNDNQYMPLKIKSIDVNTVRVFSVENITTRAVILG